MNLRTCNACGWVHMGVSAEYARAEVERFNAYFVTLSDEERREYYSNKPASLELYTKCHSCGGPWTNFRPAVDGDCPDGCTIGPIVTMEEN